MIRRDHRTTDERFYAPEERFTSTAVDTGPARSERERQMAEFAIVHDGLRYRYNGYRYDKLADAVAYANLSHTRPGRFDAGGPSTHAVVHAPPTDAERSLMASLDIDLVDGTYRFADYRYERLADAVNYARSPLRRERAERA